MTRTTARFRRRGVSYVFFLSMALLVTIIGVSGLTVVRVRLRAAQGSNDREAAGFYAQSAIDHALLAIYSDTGWRAASTLDVWSTKQAIGRGECSWKLDAEGNPSFRTDGSAPVRVHGRGSCGEAVWIYSVLVQPPLEELPTNTLVNGDFESGTTGWGKHHCDIESSSVGPHGGLSCLLASNRTSPDDAGPYQEVTNILTSGTTYSVDLWVRLRDTPEDVAILLWVESSGWESFALTAPAGTGWTHITGRLTPTWDGELKYADVLVATTTSTQDIYIDDVRMRRVPTTIGPIPGTWRREAQ